MDKLNRPCWDDVFMSIVYVMKQRSFDTSTKAGCVAVSQDRTLLSAGYNGPPSGCDDIHVPMTRPEKYDYMEHGERNCINNAAKNGIRLDNATFYVSGLPCIDCLRSMLCVGAKEIIYSPYISRGCADHPKKDVRNFLLKDRDIILTKHLSKDFIDVLINALKQAIVDYNIDVDSVVSKIVEGE